MSEPLNELIERQRFPGVPAWVMPGYDGWSNMNVINSLLAYFYAEHGVPLAFHQEFVSALGGAQKLLLLVLDGMGWYNIERAHGWRSLIRNWLGRAIRWPVTSIFPSTTSAAMASLTTGVPPAVHGVIGFLMYFPEYQHVFNMLKLHHPANRAHGSALLRLPARDLSGAADHFPAAGGARVAGRRLYQPGVCQQRVIAPDL